MLVGGPGDDVLRASNSMHLELCAGTRDRGACGGDDPCEANRVHVAASSSCTLRASGGNDVLDVSGYTNSIIGGPGDDVLCVRGGQGNTIDEGRGGADRCYNPNTFFNTGFDGCAPLETPLACDAAAAKPDTCAADSGAFGEGDAAFDEAAGGDAAAGPSCDSKKGRDSKSWLRKETPTKTCEWVKQKPSTRCRKKDATGARAETECVRTCASCPSEGACADDPMWSRANKKNKEITCAKVARNPARRCGMDGARDACAKTCGAC